MAINLDHFIFNSEYIYEQNIDNTQDDVVVSGTISAGASVMYTSSWRSMGEATRIRATAYIPGTIYFSGPTAINSTYVLPMSAIYDYDNALNFYAGVQVNNGQYRCYVLIANPYSYTINSMNRTVSFDVYTYTPLPRT